MQSNFNDSNTFGSIEICSRHGYFEPLRVNHTHMKIPIWNPGGNDTYVYNIFLAYSVRRFTILEYRRSFIFSNRSKEFDLFEA